MFFAICMPVCVCVCVFIFFCLFVCLFVERNFDHSFEKSTEQSDEKNTSNPTYVRVFINLLNSRSTLLLAVSRRELFNRLKIAHFPRERRYDQISIE